MIYLNQNGDRLAIGQDLMQRLGTEYVAQRRGGQQFGRLGRVLDVDHGDDRVEDAKVDDGVHRHRHRVFRQYLIIINLDVLVSCAFV